MLQPSTVDVLQVRGDSYAPSTTTVTSLQKDSGGYVTMASGTTVPTDAQAGFQRGCLFFKTNGGVGTSMYVNEGSTTSTDFNAFGSGGVTTFVGLSDVPAAYAGGSLKYVRVNVGETALEFSTFSLVNADIDAAAAIAWSKMAVSTDISITGTVTDLTIAGEAQGEILYFDGTNWVSLGVGAAGQALVTAGAGADPYWGLPTVSLATSLANTVTCEAGATDYTLDFGTAGGAYTLTIPAVGGARSFAFIDEAQAFSAVQTFTNEGIHILDTNASHDLVLKAGSDLTGDRILTFTTGDAARTVTLTGDLAMSGAFDLTLTITAGTNVTLPTTGTLATLAGAEVLSSKTLTLPQINDTSADHQYIFGVNELAADRTVTLPLLTGNDVFVFADFEQTLTLKTLTTPVIASVYADAAKTHLVTVQDATQTLIGRDTADTLTNKTLDCDGTGNVITNVNADELDPITMGASTYGVPFVITYTLTNQAAAVNVFNANAPFKFRVIDVYSVATSADGGTWKLNNGAAGAGTDLHSAVTVAASDTDIDHIVDMDDAAWEIGANGSLSIVPDGGGALDCILFITCMRVN